MRPEAGRGPDLAGAGTRFSGRWGKLLVLAALAAAWLAVQPCPAVARKAPAKHQAPAKSAETPDTVDVPSKVLTEPNAFHGVKWGTPLSAVPDLKLEERAGQAAYATNPKVTYRIGGAFLTNVVYGFCQDKFAAVLVEYKGRQAHESIRKFLVSKYTQPMELEGSADNLAWPIGNVLIRMEFFADKDAGALSYFYNPLYAPCGDGEKAGNP
jgi:hypothetical protein